MTVGAVTLHGIVRALGGDIYQGGLRANVPAPGHSPSDRSVSLLISEGRVVAHGFGGTDWRVALDDLRRRGLIDGKGQPRGGHVTQESRTVGRPERRRVALELWEGALPIEGDSLSARHLRSRGILGDAGLLEDIRHHPAAPLAVYGQGAPARSALIAAVRDPAGALTAVELTYLDPNGRRAAGLRLSRKTVGVVPPGSAVRLAPTAAEHLVGEGLVTTLSAMARFGLPGWALLSVRNLAVWSPPQSVRRVIVAADRGRPGEAAALQLAKRLRMLGVGGRVRFPPAPFEDWNEAVSRR